MSAILKIPAISSRAGGSCVMLDLSDVSLLSWSWDGHDDPSWWSVKVAFRGSFGNELVTIAASSVENIAAMLPKGTLASFGFCGEGSAESEEAKLDVSTAVRDWAHRMISELSARWIAAQDGEDFPSISLFDLVELETTDADETDWTLASDKEKLEARSLSARLTDAFVRTSGKPLADWLGKDGVFYVSQDSTGRNDSTTAWGELPVLVDGRWGAPPFCSCAALDYCLSPADVEALRGGFATVQTRLTNGVRVYLFRWHLSGRKLPPSAAFTVPREPDVAHIVGAWESDTFGGSGAEEEVLNGKNWSALFAGAMVVAVHRAKDAVDGIPQERTE